ncbi:hypothetical protein ACJX0J_017588, partial [Zea mays]
DSIGLIYGYLSYVVPFNLIEALVLVWHNGGIIWIFGNFISLNAVRPCACIWTIQKFQAEILTEEDKMELCAEMYMFIEKGRIISECYMFQLFFMK